MTSSDNLQSQVIGLILAFPAVATVAVVLRICSRIYIANFALEDDWIICFSGILYWGETISSYYVIKYQYLGYHIWDIPADSPQILGAKYAYATEILYNPILGLIKTSILVFLLRLSGQKIAVRRTIWVILVLNATTMVVTFFVIVLNCIPIAAVWDKASYPDAKCLNFANIVTATASASIITDVLVLMLPTWIVYNIRIPQRQKLMLVGVLSFGLLAVIAGIVRVILLDHFDRHPPYDYTYSLIFCISTIEVSIAFITACAPSLKPLVVKIIPHFFASKGRSDAEYNKRSGPGLGQIVSAQQTNWNQDTDKNGILMTTEMEVRWDGDGSSSKNPGDGNDGDRQGDSAESLFRYP
ncbi:hypothetical protein BO70DRAFT_370587 [Aspergillus heteromorphus CBS 117.55]|uniref:Rhodopsin domain-containing protein n=1 Tax=Aspergillus heteromorphus CBS 117.55 TaxID=1448321 RepID=A0A317WF57_9EURO|nr:uncharacterized protein BO70DRAFT_370587 [Aspergillus heteromorphus CBS 117.55]PWY85074.1 hypothetical protein BO70DRAFT_370587 [Aspergillus heteromorphus CBS 117.55]